MLDPACREMPYKPQPFDYEPIRPRRANSPEMPEDDERFTVSARPHGNAAAAAPDAEEWLSPKNRQRPSRVETPLDAAAPEPPAPRTARSSVKRHNWVLRRGHTLSFVGLFLFTLVLYFRPYELFPALSSLRTLAFWIAVSTLLIFLPSQLAMEGNLTARPREVNLILLLTLAAFLSIPLAIDPGEAWGGFVEFAKVVVMFIVMVNVMRTERRLRILLFLALAVGCVVSLGAINDYQLGNFTVGGERIAGIIGGMFANSNDLALHLVMMTPIAVALFFSTRNVIKKAFFGACAGLMVAGNLVTFSRGGLLGLLGALVVLLWKLGRRHRVLVFVVALSLGFSLIIFMPGMMMERIASIFDPTSEMSGAGSAVSRRALLMRSLLVMARHPVLGVGLGNFHYVSIREQVSHNSYTQIGAELGVAAMLIYMMFMWTAFKRVRGIERETLADKHPTRFYYLAVGLEASIVGYMISSFFGSVAFQHYLYYLIGYSICLHRIYETSKPATIPAPVAIESETKRGAGRGRKWRASLPETANSQ
jgi:O-antigen ligase